MTVNDKRRRWYDWLISDNRKLGSRRTLVTGDKLEKNKRLSIQCHFQDRYIKALHSIIIIIIIITDSTTTTNTTYSCCCFMLLLKVQLRCIIFVIFGELINNFYDILLEWSVADMTRDMTRDWWEANEVIIQRSHAIVSLVTKYCHCS